MQTTTSTDGPVLAPQDPLVTSETSAQDPATSTTEDDSVAPEHELDCRETLFNGGETGRIQHIQMSTERIVRLNGILFDIDPGNLRTGPLVTGLSQNPEEFYEQCVKSWLANHPVLAEAEVRATGTGLHAILWIDPPVDFANDAFRKRWWCSIVKIVQAALPTDPMAPGLTATTRAIGSINCKNGQVVRQLKGGRPVSPEDVVALSDQMCGSPFATVFKILTGTDRISPCPICGWESLVALKHIGKCYACGKVTFERLCEELFQPRKAPGVANG